MTEADTNEDTPNHFSMVLEAIESAIPLLRNSVARGEVPHGGLSATLLSVRALAQVCATVMEADDLAFREAVDACKDDDDVG